MNNLVLLRGSSAGSGRSRMTYQWVASLEGSSLYHQPKSQPAMAAKIFQND
jgi:hypothetical protein